MMSEVRRRSTGRQQGLDPASGLSGADGLESYARRSRHGDGGTGSAFDRGVFQGLLELDNDHLDEGGAYVPQWSGLSGATTDGYFITPINGAIYSVFGAFSIRGVPDTPDLVIMRVGMIGGDETDINGGHGDLLVQGSGDFQVGVPWITLLGPGLQAAGITGPFIPLEGVSWRVQINGAALVT